MNSQLVRCHHSARPRHRPAQRPRRYREEVPETRRGGTLVKITASAVSLNVDDVGAPVGFVTGHVGYTEELSADGLASRGRPDAGMTVVFLRRGLETLPADQRDDHAG